MAILTHTILISHFSISYTSRQQILHLFSLDKGCWCACVMDFIETGDFRLCKRHTVLGGLHPLPYHCNRRLFPADTTFDLFRILDDVEVKAFLDECHQNPFWNQIMGLVNDETWQGWRLEDIPNGRWVVNRTKWAEKVLERCWVWHHKLCLWCHALCGDSAWSGQACQLRAQELLAVHCCWACCWLHECKLLLLL